MKLTTGDRSACSESSTGLVAVCVIPRISAEPGAWEKATIAIPSRNTEMNQVRGRVNSTLPVLLPDATVRSAPAPRAAASVRWPPLGEVGLHLCQDLSLLQD